MKAYFRVLIILLGLLLCSTNSYAQKISLSYTRTPLRAVLKGIEKQCDYTFVYSNALSGIDERVDISAKDEQLEIILKSLLEPKSIVYKITEKQIVLTPRGLVPAESSVMTSAPPVNERVNQSKPIVKGSVRDRESGEPIPYATIIVKENRTIGAITDLKGDFSITPDNGGQT